MERTEIAKLAAAVNLLRNDWPTNSLQKFITAQLASYPLEDAAPALVRVAVDPESSTPARVLQPGPWWPAPQRAETSMPPRFEPEHIERADAGTVAAHTAAIRQHLRARDVKTEPRTNPTRRRDNR